MGPKSQGNAEVEMRRKNFYQKTAQQKEQKKISESREMQFFKKTSETPVF